MSLCLLQNSPRKSQVNKLRAGFSVVILMIHRFKSWPECNIFFFKKKAIVLLSGKNRKVVNCLLLNLTTALSEIMRLQGFSSSCGLSHHLPSQNLLNGDGKHIHFERLLLCQGSSRKRFPNIFLFGHWAKWYFNLCSHNAEKHYREWVSISQGEQPAFEPEHALLSWLLSGSLELGASGPM